VPEPVRILALGRVPAQRVVILDLALGGWRHIKSKIRSGWFEMPLNKRRIADRWMRGAEALAEGAERPGVVIGFFQAAEDIDEKDRLRVIDASPAWNCFRAWARFPCARAARPSA